MVDPEDKKLDDQQALGNLPPEVQDALESLHPISSAIAMSVQKDEQTGRFFVIEEACEELKNALYQEIEDEEDGDIEGAVFAVRTIAEAFRERQDALEAARTISSLIQDSRVEKALKAKMVSADPEVVQQRMENFNKFADRKLGNKTAPARDAAKPLGSKTLDELGFPKKVR